MIPGHIAVTTLKDLDEYQRFNADLVASVETAVKAGRSIDQATSDAAGVAKNIPATARSA